MPQPSKNKNTKQESGILEDAANWLLPDRFPLFLKRLVVLKLVHFLVKQGFMDRARADAFKGKSTTTTIVPNRQLFTPTTASHVVSAPAISGREEVVFRTLSKLMDIAFVNDGDTQPNPGNLRTFIDLASRQGVSEDSAKNYLLELLDPQTLEALGLKTGLR